jgi:hypothetical protein
VPRLASLLYGAVRAGGPLPQNGRRPRSRRVSDRETDPEIIPGDHIPTDSAVEIKDLNHQIAHSSRYSILSPPCDTCGSLKGKFFHVTKENTELKQEIVYFLDRLQRQN